MVRIASTGQSLKLVRRTLLAESLLHTKAAQNFTSSSSMPSTMSTHVSDCVQNAAGNVNTVELGALTPVEQATVTERNVLESFELFKLYMLD
jgi:hypothetical protein